eukprot:745708-Hanusia_phi.AAC.7
MSGSSSTYFSTLTRLDLMKSSWQTSQVAASIARDHLCHLVVLRSVVDVKDPLHDTLQVPDTTRSQPGHPCSAGKEAFSQPVLEFWRSLEEVEPWQETVRRPGGGGRGGTWVRVEEEPQMFHPVIARHIIHSLPSQEIEQTRLQT